jgi:hypothetical protein
MYDPGCELPRIGLRGGSENAPSRHLGEQGTTRRLELAPIGEGGNEVEPSKRGTFTSNRAACAHLIEDVSSIDATS